MAPTLVNVNDRQALQGCCYSVKMILTKTELESCFAAHIFNAVMGSAFEE